MLGWTSAVAAYGAFIAPVVIGGQIRPAPGIRHVRLCRCSTPCAWSSTGGSTCAKTPTSKSRDFPLSKRKANGNPARLRVAQLGATMSHFLDRLNFTEQGAKHLRRRSRHRHQRRPQVGDCHRNRWRHDKVVRSTPALNCTGAVLEDFREERSDRLTTSAREICPTTRPAAASGPPLLVSPPTASPDDPRPGSRPLPPSATAKRSHESHPDQPGKAHQVRRRRGLGFVRTSWEGDRNRRRRQRPHHQEVGPDRIYGFSADSPVCQ